MPFTVYEVPNRGKKKIAAWQRRAIIDDKNNVFVTPGVAGMSEMAAYLCLAYDGEPAVTDDGHIYVPAEWIKQECPECKDLVDKIVQIVTERGHQHAT